MNKIEWHKSNEQPHKDALCLIVINRKIVPDVFIYKAKTKEFVVWNLVGKDITEIKSKLGEVNAWICINELPLGLEEW